MKRSVFGLVFGSLMILLNPPAMTGEADVVGVKISKDGSGAYRFDVSVRHGDEGWKHYADGWDVVAPDGNVLGTRPLAHPHENEQPFTRSLAGVRIPDGVNEVSIRAHDLVHGHGGAEMKVQAPVRANTRANPRRATSPHRR